MKNANQPNQKEPFDFKGFFERNKLKVLVIGGAVVVLIILCIAAGTSNKKATEPVPLALDMLLSVPDANAAELNPDKVELTPAERDGIKQKSYPAPSFVSSSEDTLVYKNGLYVKVDTILPEEITPDTIEVEGSRYVKLDKENDGISETNDTTERVQADSLKTENK